jgi:hyperosmotically inducible periplasmic protein
MLRRATSLLGLAALIGTIAACSHTDPGVTTAVKAKLGADDRVKAYPIAVDTNSGVVTLSGTVETTEAKTRAVQVARMTTGVTSVEDHLTIAPPPVATSGVTGPLSDGAITATVKTALFADPLSSGWKIDVDTSNGVVTISGMVATQAEKTRAEEVAKASPGVSSFVNNLNIAPRKTGD